MIPHLIFLKFLIEFVSQLFVGRFQFVDRQIFRQGRNCFVFERRRRNRFLVFYDRLLRVRVALRHRAEQPVDHVGGGFGFSFFAENWKTKLYGFFFIVVCRALYHHYYLKNFKKNLTIKLSIIICCKWF